MLLPSSPHSQCRVCGQLQTHAAAPRQSQRTAVPPAWSRAGADAAWDRNQRASMQVGPPASPTCHGGLRHAWHRVPQGQSPAGAYPPASVLPHSSMLTDPQTLFLRPNSRRQDLQQCWQRDWLSPSAQLPGAETAAVANKGEPWQLPPKSPASTASPRGHAPRADSVLF